MKIDLSRRARVKKFYKSGAAIFNLSLFSIVCLALIVSFAACRNPATNEPNASVLRIVTSFKIQNLDPTKAAHYYIVEYGVAETPLMYEDSGIKPWLLESYAQIDELNWRLVLRPDVKFQNGKPLTAEAFAAAMNRQLKLSTSTKLLLRDASVRVSGGRELILTTKTPDPSVPAALADEEGFPIYDVEAIEAAGSDPNKLLCDCYTGAYKFAAFDDREMRLTRNADYWRGTPPFENVEVKVIGDTQARILAVQNDEADIALYPPTEAKRMLENQKNAFFVTSQTASGGPVFLFNTRHAPFDDAAVRRAVGFGLNYESLATNVMDGVFDTAKSFYPQNLPWAIENQATDLERAKALLDEAGWREGADKIRYKNNQPLEAVVLVYPQQPDWVTLATAIQGQLHEVGFRLQIRQVDSITAAMKEPDNWNASVYPPGVLTVGGAPEPVLREYLTSKGESNFGGLADAELDRLTDELSRTFDETKRTDLLRRIQQIIVAEKAYQLRLVFVRSRVIVGVNYRSYKPSPQLRHVTYETKPDTK